MDLSLCVPGHLVSMAVRLQGLPVHGLAGLGRSLAILGPPVPCRPRPRSLTFFFALNALAKHNPQTRWQLRIQTASRLLGCYDVLMRAQLGEE